LSPQFKKERDCPLFRRMNNGSADFMNNSWYMSYSRVEVAVDARRRPMKLWSSTAIGPQQSRCSEIGSPEGEKMPTVDEIMLIKVDLNNGSADFMNNSCSTILR